MKILNTRNYRLFQNNSGENRPLDIKRHKKLEGSMKKYGYLAEFPIIVFRDSKGNLIVIDGQHRLAIAEKLGLLVYYIESKTKFDVAEINTTPINWVLKDYAQKYAANGIKSYQEGLEFAEQHNLPIGMAFSLLSGTTSWGNLKEQFFDGDFKIKDKPWADAVVSIYGPLVSMSKAVRKTACLEACMAVSRVPDFDPKRLLRGAELCREKLVSYSTREAYLDMFEYLYNFNRRQLIGLRAAATMAMRERSASFSIKKHETSPAPPKTKERHPTP